MDVLRALPGVTESNYHQLAAKVLCLQDLFVMPLAAMQAIIGAENGRKLHSFVNTQASVARCAFPGDLCVLRVFCSVVPRSHARYAGAVFTVKIQACTVDAMGCSAAECPQAKFGSTANSLGAKIFWPRFHGVTYGPRPRRQRCAATCASF